MSTTDQDIQRLLRNARSAERDVDGARARRAAAEGDLKTYERRLEQVRGVKSTLSGVMNGYVGDVDTAQTGIRVNFVSATSGFAHEEDVASSLLSDAERSTEQDAYGSQMHYELSLEISRCEQQIDDARRRISSAESDEAAALSRRSSCVRQARVLGDREDATINVNVKTRY